ncbi:glyoxalase superfamily protein [Bradyrhizobium sp. NAS96.2]|uniref:glyoxalase superfamily protein n=1 Tax=Bradyrhizobium sp. NAS96.2 TaxID=1680160 RepID=UPI001FDA1D38|nr:glyoxalase superfamily protein [Bradyrhizobium sp. NAS96.2]
MAQTLREALGAKSIPLTQSDSLELIARLFGQRDWNTLAARIQSAGAASDVAAAAPPSDAVRQEIAVATAVLDRYAGYYQLSEQAVLSVTRDGQQLSIQLTGQRAVPFFAESRTEFFAKEVDAQIGLSPAPMARSRR